MTVDKREKMQISCNAEDAELNDVAVEKDVLVKGVTPDKEARERCQ